MVTLINTYTITSTYTNTTTNTRFSSVNRRCHSGIYIRFVERIILSVGALTNQTIKRPNRGRGVGASRLLHFTGKT